MISKCSEPQLSHVKTCSRLSRAGLLGPMETTHPAGPAAGGVRLKPILASTKRQSPVTEGAVEVKCGATGGGCVTRAGPGTTAGVVCGMLGFPSEAPVDSHYYR